MAKELFGTDGIRGEANTWPITPEVALRVGRAIARVSTKNKDTPLKVIIGKDTRLSGYMLETALTAGLVSEGVKVSRHRTIHIKITVLRSSAQMVLSLVMSNKTK